MPSSAAFCSSSDFLLMLVLRPRSWSLSVRESPSGSDSELAASNKCPIFKAIFCFGGCSLGLEGLVLMLSVAVGFRVSGGFSSGIRFGFEVSVGFGTSGMLLVPSNKFV